jgi:hypothetical protein
MQSNDSADSSNPGFLMKNHGVRTTGSNNNRFKLV